MALGGAAMAATCVPLGMPLDDRIVAMLRLVEVQIGGTFGVAFYDPASGHTVGHNAHRTFGMASTFKTSLAAMVLVAGQEGALDIEETVRWTESDLVPHRPFTEGRLARGATWHELAWAVQTLSDNTAANLLLARLGGPAAVTRFWRRIGDEVSRLDRMEPELNRVALDDPRDRTTPLAMARTLERLLFSNRVGPLSRGNQAMLRRWMTETITGAMRVRAGLPSGWRSGDKTGNSGTSPGTPFHRGDIGYVARQDGLPVLFAAYHRSPLNAPVSGSKVDNGFVEIGCLLTEWIDLRSGVESH